MPKIIKSMKGQTIYNPAPMYFKNKYMENWKTSKRMTKLSIGRGICTKNE